MRSKFRLPVESVTFPYVADPSAVTNKLKCRRKSIQNFLMQNVELNNYIARRNQSKTAVRGEARLKTTAATRAKARDVGRS